jgi:hypothetical protein
MSGQQTDLVEVPVELNQLIAINTEYQILLCLKQQCRKAVRPAGFVQHLRKIHKAEPQLRMKVQEFVTAKLPDWDYDYSTVQLPTDGLAPQPILSIVNGFHCRHCQFRNHNRKNMKTHGNKEHSLKRVADDELFQPAMLQSWFQDGKERYWVVDEAQVAGYQQQIDRAAIGDIGEDMAILSGRGHENSQDEEVDNGIIREIENWRAEARQRQVQALQDAPATEKDSWLQYTAWTQALSQSKHDLVKTHQFTRKPDADEPNLDQLLRAWNRIMEQCLNTLAATDQKDTLKWWASPKNEAASQRPFELPQSSKVIHRYSMIWEGLICYMMRTAPMDDWEDESGESSRQVRHKH